MTGTITRVHTQERDYEGYAAVRMSAATRVCTCTVAHTSMVRWVSATRTSSSVVAHCGPVRACCTVQTGRVWATGSLDCQQAIGFHQ